MRKLTRVKGDSLEEVVWIGIAFCKKVESLKAQMSLYQQYCSFLGPYRALKLRILDDENSLLNWQQGTPTEPVGLSDRIWSLRGTDVPKDVYQPLKGHDFIFRWKYNLDSIRLV